VDDGVNIERANRAEVDHLGVDLLVVEQFFSGAKEEIDLASVANEGDIVALASDACLAKWHGVLTVRNFALGAVEGACFHKDNRVVVTDRGQHHSLGIVRGRRSDDLETGKLTVEAFETVSVL